MNDIKIDYNGVAKEIMDILLDPCELTIHSESSHDEDGFHESHEFYPTKKQQEQVLAVLRGFLLESIETYINAMFATEDAKRIHYK